MDGNTTLGVLFGLGLGAASCLVVVVNGQTSPAPAAFKVTSDCAIPGPDGTASPATTSSDREALCTAVQKRRGSKLDEQRRPVDVLAIDSAQRPLED